MSDFDDFSLGAQYKELGDALNPKALEGDFEAVITKCDAAKTSAGKQCLRLNFKIQGGPSKGRDLFMQWTWSPENDTAAQIFAGNLAAAGATQEWIMKENPKMAVIAAKIRGAKVMITCRKRDFNGREQTDVTVKRLITPGGADVAAVMASSGSAAGAGVASDAEDLSMEDFTMGGSGDSGATSGGSATTVDAADGTNEKVLVPADQSDASDLNWP